MTGVRRDMTEPPGTQQPSSSLKRLLIRWVRRVLPPGALTALLSWLGVSGVGDLMRSGGVFLLSLAGVLAVAAAACRWYTNRRVESAEPRLIGRLTWLEVLAAALFVAAAATLLSGYSLAATVVGGVAIPTWLVTESTIVLRTRGCGIRRLGRRFTKGTPVGRFAHGVRLTLRTWPFDHVFRVLDRITSSRRNRVSGFVVLVGLIAGAGVASALGVTVTEEISRRRETSPASTPETRPATPKNLTESSRDGGVAAAEIPETFSSVCAKLSHVLPGVGAPDWATAELRNLYFKRGTGAGAVVAGCPQTPIVVTDEFDTVVYQLGFGPAGELRSVALTTMSHGSTIFLGEPAVRVRTLLAEGLAVAGSPRVDVANGDLQLAHTADGTTTFIRSTKVELSQVSPYVQLGPAQTEAWLNAMARVGTWLWPEPLDDAIGLFPQPGDSLAVARVSVDGTGATAELQIDDTTLSFSTTGSVVSIDDLSALGMP